MSNLLRRGQVLRSRHSNLTCTVEEFLGGGGQGEVYRAKWGTESFALKWYFSHTATTQQYRVPEDLHIDGQRRSLLPRRCRISCSLAITLHMMVGAAAPAPRDFNYRVLRSWSFENDSGCSFRAFVEDISLWVMLTDLQPHQQCAAIITRLGGAADKWHA